MTDSIRYTPILKSKPGETGALRYISPAYKGDSLYPLIEVNEEANTTTAKLITDAWGRDDAVMVDCGSLGALDAKDFHAMLLSSGLKVVPALGGNKAEHIEVVRAISAESKRGACLRVPVAHILLEKVDLLNLCEKLCLEPEQVDLVIDFGPITVDDSVLFFNALESLKRIPSVLRWRNFVFAASSFPRTLSELATGAFIKSISSPERNLWKQLQTSDVVRKPAPSDYAVTHPDRSKAPKFRAAANIRYTLDDGYLVLKGLKRNGNPESRRLCRLLVQQPQYRGPDYSPGDREIWECAQGHGGPGDSKTWRRRDTIHHITVVLDQIANLS